MRNFIKALQFWRYRALYFSLLKEHADAGRDVQRAKSYAVRATEELTRMRNILAPYGETILSGQAEELDPAEIHPPHRPIMLPALEFEMAKAFLNSGSRLTGPAADFAGGYELYHWRGRPVRCNGIR